MEKNSSNVFAIIVTFIFCVFAGIDPTLTQVRPYPVVNWPWYISYATWTAEATYYTWIKYLTDNDHVDIPLQEGADHYGFDVNHGLSRSIGALIALGVGMRLITMLILWYKCL